MSEPTCRPFSRRAALLRLGGAWGAVGFGTGPLALLGSERERSCSDLDGKRIRWLVGWSPGGGYDAYSRLLEPFLERRLGAQVVIENIPGAAGVVAARQLTRARPDGRTLAIVNGTGLLIGPWSNPAQTPDIHTGFTILGRIVRHHQILLTGPGSGIRSVEDLARSGRARTLVLGETGPTTINFLLAAMLEDLFGVPTEIVLGFPGSTEILAAVRRGDLDGIVVGDEAASQFPDLTPILRFGEASASEDPWYHRAPKLGGDDGLAATRPELFVQNSDQIRENAEALSTIMEVGRLVVAPADMAAALETCLADTVLSALQEDGFAAAVTRANRTVAPASAAEAREHLARSRVVLPRFQAVVERATRKARG